MGVQLFICLEENLPRIGPLHCYSSQFHKPLQPPDITTIHDKLKKRQECPGSMCCLSIDVPWTRLPLWCTYQLLCCSLSLHNSVHTHAWTVIIFSCKKECIIQTFINSTLVGKYLWLAAHNPCIRIHTPTVWYHNLQWSSSCSQHDARLPIWQRMALSSELGFHYEGSFAFLDTGRNVKITCGPFGAPV